MEAWERIAYIIDQEGLNKNSFSVACGFTSNVTVTNIINKHRNPMQSTLEKVASAFPRYNRQWVMSGNGDVLNEGYTEPMNGGETITISRDVLDVIIKQQQHIDKLIALLEKR